MRIGFGPVFKGYNGRVGAVVMEREETDQMCGVLCSEGGIIRAPGLTRVQEFGLRTGFSTTFDTNLWIEVLNGSVTWHEFGNKWSVLGAFNPTTIAAEHFLWAKRVEISSSDYYAPALAIQSDGKLKLYWTNAAGDDKSITSTLTVSTGTTYVYVARRLDDDLVLYVGTLTGTMAEWASGSGLGVENYPEDEAVNHFYVGSDPDKTNSFRGDMAYVTALDIALDELGLAAMKWPMPRLRSCLLHMRLDEATATEFEDHSTYQDDYSISHAAGVTHQAAPLVQTPKLINMLGETRVPGGLVYANVIADGQLYATRLNA